MAENPILKLKNGIRVAAVPLKERKSISVGVWVHVGGRDENKITSGVSHFLEHLVFKGTKTRSANDIKESVEGVGGSLNAFTSEEYTCFYAKCAERNFDRVFDVLADMTLNATLKPEDIEKERTVILEEIKMTQDQPAEIADELLAEVVWPNHALGRPIAGTLETVSALQMEQIRQHRDYFYEPSFLTIVAAGAIDAKRLFENSEKQFGHSNKQNAAKKVDVFKSAQAKPVFRMFDKKTEQTHISIGLHALPKNHPDEYILDMLHIILGGNMSSRLFNEVREERGLAYEIGTFVRKYHETGIFGVSAGIDNAKSQEAVSVIIQELGKAAKTFVREDELTRAKEFYLGQLDLGLESTMNQMLWVGDSVNSLGRIKTYEEVMQAVQKVTLERIQEMAKQVFKIERLNLAVVGPKPESLEKSFKNLTF